MKLTKEEQEQVKFNQQQDDYALEDKRFADEEAQAQKIYDEWGIGAKIITVSQDAKMANDKDYIELCNDDLASGFYDHNDRTVIRTAASLCANIKELADSCQIPTYDTKGNIIGHKKLDMKSAYNLVAKEHNHIVISSKGFEGQGAAMSRSHIAISKGTRHISRSDDEKSSKMQMPFKLRGT